MLTSRQHHDMKEIESIPLIRPPTAKGYWGGVPHSEFLHRIKQESIKRNWHIAAFHAWLSKNKTTIAAGLDFVQEGEWQPSIGFVNSNLHKYSMCVYGGIRLRNGYGIVFNRYLVGKHTFAAVIEFPDRIKDICKKYQDHLERYPALIKRLKEVKLSKKQVDDIILSVIPKRLIANSRILRMQRAFQESGRTIWDMLLCYAEMSRINEPIKQMGNAFTFYRTVRYYVPNKKLQELME